MRLNKFVRIVIASIFSVSFIYFTLVLRNDITPSFNHFFYNLLIWGPFFIFVLLGASYYQKIYDEESLKKIEKAKKLKEIKKLKKRKS
ncbi:hypothetical protein [uncultured Haemophilus sp.]|uniref:hypothetical protein n=1 Tax=uncultured Haemophilus sp. TaxID=237779 RepID=UPI0025E61C4D|nr:hypothetical protein [uncultured Haemophilus sp.]